MDKLKKSKSPAPVASKGKAYKCGGKTKMAKGGKTHMNCRGMGAATAGGRFKA